ncbi:hypothetical protein [Orientia tsutsugamushi]|uniref:Repeat-containing protein D n=1 Tax=Orientia tsutsugamushi TaxID=784 RepID=A0A2U3R068_ORITS|nr:hypothetical protein [Orientia tsutsugamushi]KJV97339.1 hypothetical protein OTSUT76_0100 [Orientia tsutsugamushi str. UT76]QES96521.1 hypothetical protein F0363_08430 [Orientia tsutsugamushi]SPR06633.1 repeat-containing protein D [Orientia tsutsugamushi]
MPYGDQDNLYTFNQYLDNKDNLGTKSLEAHPRSKKFLSKIFQRSLRCTYSNENLDNFVYDLDLDNLEKLLQPARIIEPPNITSMIGSNVKLDVLADTLEALTSNIDVLKNLYDLHISFSDISGKRSNIRSAAPGYLKNIFEDFKLKMKNWPGNTYEEICKLRAYVLNSLKKAKLKSYDVNSSNYDVDNDITNQTTIKQNPFDLYIANNNKLEGYSWSMKLFFREIFQKSWKSTFTNEDFDGLISSIQLDNLEKLLSPARIIGPSNITGMLVNYSTLNMRILKKTLKVLTLNINILKALYDLEIPFFTISAKLHSAGSKVADLLTEIFKSLVEMIKVHKNNEENLISFDVSEPTLASVKDKYQKDLPNIINSAFKKINSQEQNNLTINNHQSQTIDRHREDDIETNSDEINTHSDSQKLAANISNSELTTDEIFNRMLDIDDDDNIKEIVLKLNNYIANQSKNQSQTTDKYLENDREDILYQSMKAIDGTTSSSSSSICITSYQIMPSVEEVAQQPMQDDIQNSSDEINTHSDSQKLAANISNSELTTDEIFNRMLDIDDDDNIKEIVLKLNNYIANQSKNQSQTTDKYLENDREDILYQSMKAIDGTTSSSSNSICITSYQIMPSVEEVAQQPMQDDIQNSSDEINTHSDCQELTSNMSNSELTTDEIFNRMLDIDDDDNIKEIVLKLNNYIANQSENQSQPIESYQENNIENLQIIRETHTEEVMQSLEKRKSCYDEHEDLCTSKRQCNNPKLNSNHGTEVALNEQDSINVDCATSVTSYLVGESICILSDTA